MSALNHSQRREMAPVLIFQAYYVLLFLSPVPVLQTWGVTTFHFTSVYTDMKRF